MTINNLQVVKSNSSLNFLSIQFWENLIHKDEIKNNITITTLERGLNDTYVGNFYSLLSNEFNIPIEYWYPNLRINNLNNSIDYKGNVNIKIINPDILSKYYDLLILEQREKNKYGIDVR